MTLNGAIMQLVQMRESECMPTMFKPLFDKVIETVSECDEPGTPSAQPEIIRCKDCKYAEVADPEDSQDGYSCQFHRGSIWFSGSYCSWAERREE